MWSVQLGHCLVEIVDRSIVELGERFDVLVSSDDNELSHGGGVSAALWREAGPALEEQCASEHPKLALGDVYVTSAGRLKAHWLYHAITIDFDANRRVGPREIRPLLAKVLAETVLTGAETIAMPLLATGAGHLDPRAFAVAFLDALRAPLGIPRQLRRITLCAFGGSAEACVEVLRALSSPRPDLPELLSRVPADRRGELPPADELIRGAGDHKDSSSVAIALQFFERVINMLLAHAKECSLRGANDETIPRAPTPERVSIGAVLRQTAEVFQSLERPLNRDLRDACDRAVATRNRLAHARDAKDAPSAEDCHDVYRATQLGLARLLAEWGFEKRASPEWKVDADVWTHLATYGAQPLQPLKLMPSAVPRGKRAHKTAKAKPSRQQDARSEARTEVGASGFSGGTKPVRSLHRFLVENLTKPEQAELVADLRAQGYRAASTDDGLLLLEYCVHAEDPVELITSHFTLPALRRILAERGISVSITERHDTIAAKLLDQFGFPPADLPRGLATIVHEIKRLEADAHTADGRSLRSIVTEASSQLELALQILLRFVCQAAWSRSPESFFHEHGLLDAGRELSKSSLGKLLEGLEFVSKHVAADRSPGVEQFRCDFDERRLAPTGTGELAEQRNFFAHHQANAEHESLPAQRRRAQRFFELATGLLDHLRAQPSRVFPIVVRVESIQYDRFGRKTVIALSDEGHREQIFTDAVLLPGLLYLMHPLTNPLRVDPILVQAGDVSVDRSR